jgi:xanthine dehydrogenase small subunit
VSADRELFRPRSLAEALRVLRDYGPLVPLAGCTDVYVQLHFGTRAETRYVDIWGLDELRGVAALDGGLRLGALATYTEIAASPLVRERLPMLGAAAREIGGAQIQNRGTVGGNLANASPAGDTLPVLLAADAVVVARSAAEERRVPAREFFVSYRKTALRPDELVVAVEVPAVHGRQWFRKVGTRAAQAISKVVAAGVRPADGPPRLAMGSVGPTPVRLGATEQALARGALDALPDALARDIAPIDDLRSSAEYRRRVAENLVRRFWSDTDPGAARS